MTTFTISIDEKSKEGREIIAKLKALSRVKAVRKLSRSTRKTRMANHDRLEDETLASMMKHEETGKTVSKNRILKALKAVK